MLPVLLVFLMPQDIACSKCQRHIARIYSNTTPSKYHLTWTHVEAAGRGYRSAKPDGLSS